MPLGYFYDYYYVLLVLPMVILSLVIQGVMKGTYRKYSAQRNSRGITGAQAACEVLRHYGVDGVGIVSTEGKLTDHYDPRTNIIALSEAVYGGNSIAAVGIACHEAGHAAQHALGYTPVKVRNAILPVCNIGSTLSWPLIIIGFFVGFSPLVTAGIILFSAVVLFQLVTLPVEFNASSRALAVIGETGLLTEDEQRGAKKVLSAAAMTYVAALAVSVANLIRLILRFSDRR